MRKVPEGRNRHQGALTLIFVMASSGVVKVILSFYRDDEEFRNDVMASTIFSSPACNVNDLCDQYDSELKGC